MINVKVIEKRLSEIGWTKYRLAKEADIGQSTLSEILSGKKKNPSINTIIQIADALGLTLDYLTRKSTKALIEDKLDELNMTFEDLSTKTHIPMKFFIELDAIIPDEGNYERLKSVADALDMDSNILNNSLCRQEPPVYAGTATTADEDFRKIEDSSLNDEQVQILGDFNKLNDLGKQKAKERIHELTLVPTYIITNKKEIFTFAAHDDGLDPKKSEERKKLAKKIFKKMDEQ